MVNKQIELRFTQTDIKNIAFLKKKIGYEKTGELLRYLIIKEVKELKENSN